MKRVMVDLETLDSGANALILSIGAKEFDPTLFDKGWQGREFYAVANQRLQEQKWKRTVSEATCTWWDEQSEEAKRVLEESRREATPMLDTVLGKFAEWMAAEPGAEVWGNGATFDNVVLRNAYAAVGAPCPWSFRKDMCFRTLKGFNIPLGPGEGTTRLTHHNALDDAKYQAWYAERWLAKIGVT